MLYKLSNVISKCTLIECEKMPSDAENKKCVKKATLKENVGKYRVSTNEYRVEVSHENVPPLSFGLYQGRMTKTRRKR